MAGETHFLEFGEKPSDGSGAVSLAFVRLMSDEVIRILEKETWWLPQRRNPTRRCS